MMIVFTYIFPVPISPGVDMVIGFTLSAILAAPFAYLAFKAGLPTNKQLSLFILAWFLITLTAEIILNFFFYTNVWMFIIRWEFLAQMLLEIAVVLIMLRVMRRQNAYHMAAPGIDFDEPAQ
jgi:hypothetical protein